jgi:hypothetical protein
MESSQYAVELEQPPDDLLERLIAALQDQGSPAITVRQEGDGYVFEGGDSDFMLRSRAADALTTAWPPWQFNVAQRDG